MQKAHTRQAYEPTGAFQKFVAAQKAETPSVVRLISGMSDSTLFKSFQY
jgi:hypothetical protein